MNQKATKATKAGKLSLHPLSLEEALKGAMETGLPPPRDKPKRRKPKKRTAKK